MNLDHEQVSELLSAYVRGELDADRDADIRSHLEGCEECRAEWAGLRALASLPAATLEPAERVALRDAVRVASRPRSWAARLAPALGALGLVAIAVVSATTLLGDEPSGNGVTAQIEEPESGTARDEAGRAQPAPAAKAKEALENATAGQAAGGAHEGAANEGSGDVVEAETGAAAETLEFAAPMSFSEAAPLGAGLLIDRDAATSADVSRRRLDLFSLAPDDGWARQMQGCTEIVTSFLPEDARPAYAAVYEADGLLVMGFIWSQDDERRYAFWGWPRDDCSVVTPIHSSGSL